MLTVENAVTLLCVAVAVLRSPFWRWVTVPPRASLCVEYAALPLPHCWASTEPAAPLWVWRRVLVLPCDRP
jgi:hypothetical protein